MAQMNCTMDEIGKIFAFNFPAKEKNPVYCYIPVNDDIEEILKLELPYIREINYSITGCLIIKVETTDAHAPFPGEEAVCAEINRIINDNGGWTD